MADLIELNGGDPCPKCGEKLGEVHCDDWDADGVTFRRGYRMLTCEDCGFAVTGVEGDGPMRCDVERGVSICACCNHPFDPDVFWSD